MTLILYSYVKLQWVVTLIQNVSGANLWIFIILDIHKTLMFLDNIFFQIG